MDLCVHISFFSLRPEPQRAVGGFQSIRMCHGFWRIISADLEVFGLHLTGTESVTCFLADRMWPQYCSMENNHLTQCGDLNWMQVWATAIIVNLKNEGQEPEEGQWEWRRETDPRLIPHRNKITVVKIRPMDFNPPEDIWGKIKTTKQSRKETRCAYIYF